MQLIQFSFNQRIPATVLVEKEIYIMNVFSFKKWTAMLLRKFRIISVATPE